MLDVISVEGICIMALQNDYFEIGSNKREITIINGYDQVMALAY